MARFHLESHAVTTFSFYLFHETFMVLTNVLSAIGTFTVTASMEVNILACNYLRTVIALLYGIAHNICFALSLGSIFKVILKAPLTEEFSVALFANYFLTLTFGIFHVGEAR